MVSTARRRAAMTGSILCGVVAVLAASPARAAAPACATPDQITAVRKEASEFPGDPIAIVSRFVEVPEFAAATGLWPQMQVSARIDDKQALELWKSIEGWGADTMVRLVVSPSSQHAFTLYSTMPKAQPEPDPGYLDVYADGDRGIHSHIQLSKIAAITATDIPTDKPGYRTRGINFFDRDGNNVFGVYASIKYYEPDPAALAGFDRTRALIAAMPRACA
ncbi:MAG: hypothetical protein DI568_01165 [Sphingomonas sp.]|nr:MAG: hypothetical protein DI568_01165 [Sphingomonas sp.]